MAELDQETYQPETGDIRIQEVQADHFSLCFYNGRRWNLTGYISEQEIQRRPAHWRLMAENVCEGKKRQYYSSSGANS